MAVPYPGSGALLSAATPGPGPPSPLPTVLMTVRVSCPGVRAVGPGGEGGPCEDLRLQLSMDPERSGGGFRLTLRHGQARSQTVAEFNLKDVCYQVKNPKCHTLTVLGQLGEPIIFNFEDEREAQKWWTVVSSSIREVQKAAAVNSSNLHSNALPQPLLPVIGNPFRTTPAELNTSVTASTGNPFRTDVSDEIGSSTFFDIAKKEDLALRLSKAIESGDQQAASHYAIALAAQQASLQLQLKPECFPKTEISMKVGVEDATSSVNISILVHAYTTITMLKQQVFHEYGFHPRVQRWIIGQCLCIDDRTLGSYGIRKDGDTAFLYLLSAKQAHLSRQHYEEDQNIVVTRPEPRVASQDSGSADEKWKSCTLPSRLSSKKASARKGSDGSRQADVNITRLLNLDRLSLNSALPKPNHFRPPHVADPLPFPAQVGWACPICTYINKPTRPGCEMCSQDRPRDYVIPESYKPDELERLRIQQEKDGIQKYKKEQEEERVQNFLYLLQLDDEALVPNQEEIECLICYTRVPPGDGVLLRECLHSFCRECLRQVIHFCEEPEVSCPFRNDAYACSLKLQEREIRALVSAEEYRKFLERGLTVAESRSRNSYHCKTMDCKGWCIYEDLLNEFWCPICQRTNCLICKAIHEGMNCRQYQDDLRIRAQNDSAARQTNDVLKRLVQMGEAMHCPLCKIIVQKKDGCDWIRCTVCQTEICWVTKGARWGPAGPGDVSGGCRCNVDGRRCHPQCQNCH
ncbi:sharpin isoform X2 [Ambystoma mexicanum]|uniref:sharpin isoform X2 n=1 Tax=Ambystoma mexicanum TaxID=8296 RepID=UPI0037E70CF4